MEGTIATLVELVQLPVFAIVVIYNARETRRTNEALNAKEKQIMMRAWCRCCGSFTMIWTRRFSWPTGSHRR